MAEEVNNTENTENGNVQQDTNTGAVNTEPEKKYSEEEMNGISKKNSEKAVAKVLKELGITDKVKAKEILSKAVAEEAANSENNGTGEEMSQIQQALAKERERADGATLSPARKGILKFLSFPLYHFPNIFFFLCFIAHPSSAARSTFPIGSPSR